jgi:hypothetical protein
MCFYTLVEVASCVNEFNVLSFTWVFIKVIEEKRARINEHEAQEREAEAREDIANAKAEGDEEGEKAARKRFQEAQREVEEAKQELKEKNRDLEEVTALRRERLAEHGGLVELASKWAFIERKLVKEFVYRNFYAGIILREFL